MTNALDPTPSSRPSSTTTPAPRQSRLRRGARLALRLAAATLLGLLLLEGVLRFLLFSDTALAQRLGAEIRRPWLFSSRFGGREYWKLAALIDGGPDVRPDFDARFGWLKPEIDPLTLRHADEPDLAGRRPVLLFGDSFGACFVEEQDCWQGLLERSALAREYRLLNYAVVGYGLDQMLLLLRATLDLYAGLRPIVVVGIMVEDDLDRCYLALRDFPKPSFALQPSLAPEEAELVLHPVADPSRLAYVRANPIGIRSYAWRLFLINSGIVRGARLPEWTGEAGHVRTKKALCGRILAEMQRELSRRGLEGFFVLFHGRQALQAPGLYSWQEPFLVEELGARGLRFVSSRRFLLEDAAANGTPIDDAFIRAGWGFNHYTAHANAVVFQAIEQGLLGQFEPTAPGADPAGSTAPRGRRRR